MRTIPLLALTPPPVRFIHMGSGQSLTSLRPLSSLPTRAVSGDLWDVVSGAEADRARELQARIEALNARRVEMGRMTQAQADAANAAVAADDPDTYVAQVGDAFIEGAQEGEEAEIAWVSSVAENITAAPTRIAFAAASSAAKGILGNIPWWVWVAAGVGVLWWTGVIGPGLFAATRGAGRGIQRRGIRRLHQLRHA